MKSIHVILFIILVSVICCALGITYAEIKPPVEVNQSENCVIFGSYDQWDMGVEGLGSVDNGNEPIEWIVLKQDGTKLFLVSKYPLDYKQYNLNKGKYSWKNSSIRTWLNGSFIREAFSEEERKAILSVDIETGGESIEEKWPVSAKEKTKDKVFLLSRAEVKLLKDDKVQVNRFVSSKNNLIFTDDDSWWLRSSGKKEDEACYVGHGKNESGWLTDWRCVRPAMWIDYSLFDWSNSVYSQAKKSEKLYEEEKYEEAYAITDSLGTYYSSKICSVWYRWDCAMKVSEQGNYTEAIDRFIEIKDFINSNFSEKNEVHGANDKETLLNFFTVYESILDNRYQLAIQTMNSGDINNAISMFEAIGQYKDSMEYLRACYKQTHIQYSYLTDDKSVRHTNGKYNEDKPVTGDDPHWNWSLGSFMISGFTEEKEENGKRVFIKTPGDSLKLWFDLEQDINSLNGNKDLTVSNDTDGMDERFPYNRQKDGLGRGLLLIRHYDHTHKPTDPQPYTNYLEANNDRGADTKVEIKEEGEYEVALDYEVKKDELFDKINNYRIAFSFVVRNGSGMFFMFDIGSGSELQDYSRTADGFRIDLANSHSLSVSYTRYALNQDETGLDVRKTGLASDGDQFEKVGYYEITVTNRETNESLTKHIFVGRSADLEDYKAVDADKILVKFSDK